MGHGSFNGQLVVRMGSILLEGNRKAPVLSHMDRLGALEILASTDDGTASSFFCGMMNFRICVGGILRSIAKEFNFQILIALSDDTT